MDLAASALNEGKNCIVFLKNVFFLFCRMYYCLLKFYMAGEGERGRGEMGVDVS